MKIDKSWLIHAVVWTFMAGGGWFMLKDHERRITKLEDSIDKKVNREDWKDSNKAIWDRLRGR